MVNFGLKKKFTTARLMIKSVRPLTTTTQVSALSRRLEGSVADKLDGRNGGPFPCFENVC